MTPEEMAEAFERARYEQLRTAAWTDLRDGERVARIDVARQALDAAGITARFATLQTIAQDAELQAGALAQRDAEIARRRAEHEEELTAARSERDRVVAELEARCAGLRTERDEAQDLARATQARAETAEAAITAVRAALSEGALLAVVRDAHESEADANDSSSVAVPHQPMSTDDVDNRSTHRPAASAGSGGRRLPRLSRAGGR